MNHMFRRLSSVLALLFVTAAAAAAISDEKIGAGVTLEDATPIKALYEKPQEFVGKTIRIDGVVTAVCAEMGCWMALGDEEKSTQTIRFKVDHGAGIVFPLKARGMKASAQGVFERIAADDHEAQEAASEEARASAFGKTYQIKATGAVLR
jgi:Domain of unknown function (DUF4920)